jgi:hypothetical protein
MTPKQTREEIDALEREIRELNQKREAHIRRAVNPER